MTYHYFKLSNKLARFIFLSFSTISIFSISSGIAFGQEIQVNTTTVSVPEGESTSPGTLQVMLTADPVSSLTVTGVRQSGDNNIQTNPNPWTFTFNSTNWNVYQEVTLTASEDRDANNGSANIRFSATGLADVDVKATEIDNDRLNIQTNVTTVSVPEGGSTPAGTLTLQLTADPVGDLVVTGDNVSGDADIQPSPDPWSFMFDSTNWNVAQEVTLAAAEDGDITDDTATIRFSAAALTDLDVIATEIDNDVLNFLINPAAVNVPEGGKETFDVSLTAAPTASETVNVTWYSGDTDITVKFGSQLIFTPTNWADPQIVTLAAADDPDSSNGSASIRVNSKNVPEAFITATEIDNSSSEVSISPNPSSGTSGQAITVTILIADSFAPLNSFGFDLVYDQTIFNCIDAVPGVLNSGWTITEPSSSPGRVTIQASGGSFVPVNSTGSIVQLTLEVKCLVLTSNTQTPIQIENYTGDMTGQFVPEPCSTTFTFLPCPSLGDVNGDSSVTPGDAQMAFEGFLGLYTFGLCEGMAADANCSGSTTPGDAQEIFEHFLGIHLLPQCCASTSVSLTNLTLDNFHFVLPTIPSNPNARQLFPLNRMAETGEIVHIPVIVTHPEGIQEFGFDMNYPTELLEYLGVTKSPMTEDFDYVTGVSGVEGLVRIEGHSQLPITERQMGSLAVAAFLVKEGLQESLPVYIYNTAHDIYDAETAKGIFTRSEDIGQNPRAVILGEAVIGLDGTVRVPLKISEKFNIKSFGLELRYSTSSLEFMMMKIARIGSEFSAIQANEVENGILKIGGYGRNEIHQHGSGRLMELIFFRTDFWGEVEFIQPFDQLFEIEIIQLFDDIQDFIIQNEISTLDDNKWIER